LDFQCGHIISEFNGGEATIQNLIPLCQLCNSSMGKSNMDTFMETHGLLRKNMEKKEVIENNIISDDVKEVKIKVKKVKKAINEKVIEIFNKYGKKCKYNKSVYTYLDNFTQIQQKEICVFLLTIP
jgi:hypothetical protein